jgi:hypothetical protein
MKLIAYIAYSWGTTILFVLFLLWLASVDNLAYGTGIEDELVKTVYRIVLYSFLFLLIYRSIIGTLKGAVDRLSYWHTKREKAEDTEFVLVIETLVIVVTTLSCVIVAAGEEYIQLQVAGRAAQFQDVLVSTIAALLTGLIVYSAPLLGEVEMYLYTRTKSLAKRISQQKTAT